MFNYSVTLFVQLITTTIETLERLEKHSTMHLGYKVTTFRQSVYHRFWFILPVHLVHFASSFGSF